MKPLITISFTADEWRAIRNAVAARGDSIYGARDIIELIEGMLKLADEEIE